MRKNWYNQSFSVLGVILIGEQLSEILLTMIDVFYPIPKLLDTILTEIYAENCRKHEERRE
jgi:hypothetical protein